MMDAADMAWEAVPKFANRIRGVLLFSEDFSDIATLLWPHIPEEPVYMELREEEE